MSRPHQRGPQGVRQDRFSGSKVTNLTPFQPFYSATEKTYAKYYDRFKNRTLPFIAVEAIHRDFIFPLDKDDIQDAVGRVPSQFVKGIKAILVPSGSMKQIKVMKSLYMFGEFWQKCVFLHPYPRCRMRRTYRRKPNPKVLQEDRRVGATITPSGTGVEISFDESSLKQFYLRDVLMHEIGHHNDGLAAGKPRKKREAYAEWFASEYGFRLWREA